jgi:hypothetical protein
MSVMQRFIWFIVALVGVLIFPWYLTAIILLVGFILYPKYIEGVALAFVYDGLYVVLGAGHTPVWSIVAVSLLILSFTIRPLLR